MAADVKFCFKDGTTGGSYTTLTSSLRFKTADNNTGASTDDPLVRPTSGTNYSYTKNLRVRVVSPPAVALLSLRVKLSTAAIAVGADTSSIGLAYSWFVSSSTQANVITSVPGRIGTLGTTEVPWTNGATGTAAGTHVAGSANEFWALTGSDQLFLQMELGVGSGTGGSVTPFNVIAVYNEI